MYYYYYGEYDDINGLLDKLKKNRTLPVKEFKSLLEGTYNLLQKDVSNQDWYNLALSVICHVSEYLPNDSLLQELLLECISASRVFLYRDMLSEKNQKFKAYKPSSSEEFARAFYTLDTDTTLTKDQRRLFNYFQEHRRIVVSAPTSFGKSRIISEIINHNSYSNIAIVLPTIALLTETFIRLRSDDNISSKYNLVNSLKQPLKAQNNILIFTPEKIDMFLDDNKNFKINFFVMDEIYKIQDDGDRSKIFTNSLYRLSKTNADFYLIGPYFDKFSEQFLSRTNSKFIKFESEIVQKDIIDLSICKPKEKVIIGDKEIKVGKADTNLKNILKNSTEQSLAYVGDKRGVESKAKLIADNFEEKEDKSGLISYLESTFSKDWSLVYCLKRGVAFHHAGIPKFIQVEIVDSFNSGEINVVVCSPTLIEGVNTAAKQVIIYDDVKGGDLLTDFDVKNINGRAGRFLQHFIGRSIALTNLPKNQGEKSIEFSFFDKELSDDELLQVDKEDLKLKNLAKRKELEEYLKKHNVPIELVKKNKFIPVENQVNLINYFRNKAGFFNQLHFNTMPTTEQYDEMIDLIYNFLFVKKYKENRAIPIWDLKYHSKGYIYHNITLKQLIDQQEAVSIDTKIRRALGLVTNYFEFALPKYFTVFQNIFNFVCEEESRPEMKISVDLMVMKLEYGVVSPHEIALKEAGIPIMIVKNIENVFRGCQDINEIREKYFKNKSIINKLQPYEQKIFRKYI